MLCSVSDLFPCTTVSARNMIGFKQIEFFGKTFAVENALVASFDTTAGPLEYFDPTGIAYFFR